MNIKETQLFVAAADLANKAPLIQGKHGLGKSEIVKQYADENNMHFEPLILSLMDTGDLLGLPRTVEVGGTLTTSWAAPEWFNRIVNAAWPLTLKSDDLVFHNDAVRKAIQPRLSATVERETLNNLYCEYKGIANDALYLTTQIEISYTKSKRSILFLDEFNRAPVDILNASLQLVLDKRLNSHRLPFINGKPTFVVAAINPADSDYTVNTFDPALLDRFLHGSVEPDAKAWLDDYARPRNLSPVVRDFIAEHPDRIHYTPVDGGVGATPRSWAALADVMDVIDRIAPEVQFQVMKGCVGHECASQFLSYYNNYAKVVKVEDIEKLVKQKSKTIKDIEKLGEHVNKLIANQEAMQKTELTENLYKKYLVDNKNADATNSLPLMATLYGLDLEILNAFLKNKKNDDVTNYMRLAEVDQQLNNRNLFRKITTKVQA